MKEFWKYGQRNQTWRTLAKLKSSHLEDDHPLAETWLGKRPSLDRSRRSSLACILVHIWSFTNKLLNLKRVNLHVSLDLA